MVAGFFAAVEEESALFPMLQRLRPAVAGEFDGQAAAGTTVQAELRARRRSSGEIVLRRFYWSTQVADPGTPLGFRARTLYCDATPDAVRAYDFPAEPLLDWLDQDDGPLRCHGDAATIAILRYIPLRRLTFLLRDGVGLPAGVIAKVKSHDGLHRAAAALLAVHEAAARGPSRTPTVPRLLRLDAQRHVLYLEQLPGEPLDTALHRVGLTPAMEALGALHRDLQELDVRGLARRETVDWLRDARQAAAQVGLFVPSTALQAQAVYDVLAGTAPEDGELCYCQGDFVPGQVLYDPSGWSVIDLDDSHYADPLSEAAGLYAALAHDLELGPGPADEARRTYLEAYERRAGRPVDPVRWRWFLAVAELRDLARRLVKGRAAPGEVQAVLDGITAPALP